jgi:hypothetical protein
LPETSPDEEVIRVNHLAADLRFCAAKSDICDLVLPTTGRAAAEMHPNLILVPTAGSLQLIDQLDHSVLGFGHGEIAELDAGAGDAAFPEIG